MTDKDIRQALECCEAYSCSGCPFYEYMGYKCEGADAKLIGLIKRQQAEITWLKEALQTQTDILESGANSNEFCFEEDKIRAKAIKVFVEKLKKISVENTYWGGKTIYKMVSLSRIEQIAEEMVGARDE